jgi:glc operon protein GlcG
MRQFLFIASLTISLVAGTTHAQLAAARKSLTIEGAKKVIAASVAEAKRLNTSGVIAVVDDGGNLMALERLDNTFAAGALISYGKARTSALFKKPTKAFEEIIKNGRTPMVALNDFTPLQGGVPIVVDGQIVGAVGVSGAASAQQDEELALAGAKSLESASATSAAPVTFFGSEKVADAFEKGAVLFDARPFGANFEVHASKRSAPGQAEVHTNETDVIYVLDGEATFVTGGKVVEGQSIGPNEIRGSEIAGGEERRIARGDVIIVPAGRPHWFKQVPATFHYYVVKVVS